ncbi:hypothetical protein E3Q23_00676 [Wallemia mellicola]|uniref:Zn(2)-C6 fungal-type domain-containing protein n=1 Tax=Wallemia mellicola TaxID=1708541 RepID=A0A4T0R6G6_9BASI|nr:hypothetical protein E3Q23_00676 [Wallemia mellicola]TIB93861.1 hypothetical protein E3Q19_00728 [Wallemia mellicola]TIC14263.1 hypothetical protein E3Q14_00991 [Wallemia mellicola]TIC30634.1 hypothetical protein E3Q11_00855 [Wallemia mellicola]TIC32771.1 hypothetical protein E3Q10_01012 [Wallemia mellicola]
MRFEGNHGGNSAGGSSVSVETRAPIGAYSLPLPKREYNNSDMSSHQQQNHQQQTPHTQQADPQSKPLAGNTSNSSMEHSSSSNSFRPLQTKSIYSGPIPPPSLFRNSTDDSQQTHVPPTLPPLMSVEGLDGGVTRKRKSSDMSGHSQQSEEERKVSPRTTSARIQQPQQAPKRGKSARRRACEECARAKARCKVEPGDSANPPMCTRCKMYGHNCVLPEGYVIDSDWFDQEDSPKKSARRNTINSIDSERERERQRMMAVDPPYYYPSPPQSYNRFVPPPGAYVFPQQQQQQQQQPMQPQVQQSNRYGYPAMYYPPSPAPSMDVAFLQAEMASHPFLRNIAGYDLSRLSLFLSAAVRVGITQISNQPGQSSQGPAPDER